MINWGSWPVERTKGPPKPALVMPNEMIGVVFRASVDQKRVEKIVTIKKVKWRFDYRIGNYKEKSTRYERDVIARK